MAFKHDNKTMMKRYNQHQDLAKQRLSKTDTAKGYDFPTISQGIQTDVKNTHKPLPKQTAPGVNRSHNVQKDINTGTKSAHIQSQNVGLNKKTLQSDLHGSRGGVHKPGAK